jgi:hypothetical protein
MNKITLSILVLLSVAAVTVCAQRREEGPRPPGDPQGRSPVGPPGGIPRQPPGFHLMTALDADGDGKISSKEIENAVAALGKLDKDGDGKLSATEIGWPPPAGFRGFGGGRSGGRGGFPGGRGGQPNSERPPRPAAEKVPADAPKPPPSKDESESR